jgi:hypothetical protein
MTLGIRRRRRRRRCRCRRFDSNHHIGIMIFILSNIVLIVVVSTRPVRIRCNA